MVVNPTVRFTVIPSNPIQRKIDSVESARELILTRSGALHFILGRCREQDLFQRDIEGEFNLRRPTVTEIPRLMEWKGLIYREEASHDARYKRIIPTEKGWELEGRVSKGTLEMEQFITQDIPKEEPDTFI